MSSRTHGAKLAFLIPMIYLLATARGQDKLTRLEFPGFEINIPHYFEVDPNPAQSMALEAWAPPATDKRGLSWEMSIQVQVGRGLNPQRLAVDHSMTPVVNAVRAKYGGELVAGPAIITFDIPG